MSNLNVIDFSNGIRSEEIQENFNNLQSQINRERISIAGYGIASGLNLTPIVDESNFAIKISEASIITKDGEEIYVEEQVIDIPKPYLTEQCEYLIATRENTIMLNEIPYSLDRHEPVQYSDSYLPASSGINIKYTNSTSIDDGIRVKDVSGTVLTLTGLINKRSVEVKYHSTAKRIDTVYIDENDKVQVKVSSITSTTPSVILPTNYKYLIAFIEVDPFYKESKFDSPHAYITLKEDLREMRNIYTDKDGNLFLCGISFDDLQLIATSVPVNPKENQLWLNVNDNTLYVYKRVNNYSYIKSFEVTTNFQDGDEVDYTTNVTFKVNKDELSVYVNNIKLEKTEYEEMYNNLPVSQQKIEGIVHSNKFRVYKDLYVNDKITYCINFKESELMWVPINKESFVNVKNTKAYGIDEFWKGGNYWKTELAVKLGTDENNYPLKYKIFLFDRTLDKSMLFVPNRNELEVMVNQMPLHSDQFIELSLASVGDYVSAHVLDIINQDYGWETYSMDMINGEDDIGIGFMLVEPLDAIHNESIIEYPKEPPADWDSFVNMNGKIIEEELYVEAKVNRAVSSNPSKRKLQRIATYINEDNVIVENSSNVNINIKKGFYRYGESQLEVFLNGVRLANKIDYEEGTDIGNPDEDKLIYPDYIEEFYNSLFYRNKGTVTRRFTMKRPVQPGDIITYKITSTYYSYDHINSLLDEIELSYAEASSKIDALYQTSVELNDSTIAAVSSLREELNKLIGETGDMKDKYLTVSSIIGEDQIDMDIVNRIPKTLKFINCKISYIGKGNIDVTDEPYNIRNKDYITIIRKDKTNVNGFDKFLIRDVDYTIEDSIVNGVYYKTYLVLSETFLPHINNGDELIVSGIRFEREGR